MQNALQLDLFGDTFIPERLKPFLPRFGKPADKDVPAASPAGQPPAVPPAVVPQSPPTVTSDSKPRQLRRIQFADVTIEYELQRSKRRSIGFLINEQGLRITAPRWVSIADIEQAARDKQQWIRRKLAERHEREQRRLEPQISWQDGASLPYLGQTIVLRQAADRQTAYFDSASGDLFLPLAGDVTEQQWKDRVQGWLQQQALELFQQRLPHFAEKLQVSYRSVSLSSAKTRWGSCTSDGKIRLNWRLIHFSPLIIDYVIAHELAHLREMNHSPRFWATVQSIFPEMDHAHRQLREQSSAGLPVF